MTEAAKARLMRSPELGSEELARLADCHVAVVGAGGVLGSQTSYHLGLRGIGLTLIDHGRVEEPNLGNRGYRAASIGEPKSEVRAGEIRARNPDCLVRAVPARIE